MSMYSLKLLNLLKLVTLTNNKYQSIFNSLMRIKVDADLLRMFLSFCDKILHTSRRNGLLSST